MTRRGLVLGGGGVLGAAWTIGALSALEDRLGVEVSSFDELIGTSAGSVLCTLLAAGVTVSDLRTHQLEGHVDTGALAGFAWDYDEATGGDRPPAPKAGFGSPLLLRKGIRELRQLPPTAVLAALMPEGRGRLDSVGAMIRHVVPSGWVARHGLTVVAFDYDAGARVPFGREGAPRTDVADAVMASCAIPGWYSPVRIEGRRYIDGGTWSSTNLDLMVGLGLDEVYVLAPQVSFDLDQPGPIASRIERQWRARVTARALRETAIVHADGVEVTVIGPGSEDLRAIGANMMDVSRRPTVIATSLRTSLAALADPATLPEITRIEAIEASDEFEPTEL
ncbi:patatin-like phospholipase family protein [Lapillicoccus sp.]|uniref:patatin-like phospholipase family protein n=1 Tax=Lapillicoccus sp. TaxID=1909287 RepID=UPI003983ADA9